MKKTIIILNITAIICALIWLTLDVSWEPLVTLIGLIAAFIGQVSNYENSSKKTVLKQKGGKKSKNYQSQGDINITNNDKR